MRKKYQKPAVVIEALTLEPIMFGGGSGGALPSNPGTPGVGTRHKMFDDNEENSFF